MHTDEVSHGELLRAGYDETMDIGQREIEFLIQGMPAGDHKGPYPSLPWSIGLIRSREAARAIGRRSFGNPSP